MWKHHGGTFGIRSSTRPIGRYRYRSGVDVTDHLSSDAYERVRKLQEADSLLPLQTASYEPMRFFLPAKYHLESIRTVTLLVKIFQIVDPILLVAR